MGACRRDGKLAWTKEHRIDTEGCFDNVGSGMTLYCFLNVLFSLLLSSENLNYTI